MRLAVPPGLVRAAVAALRKLYPERHDEFGPGCHLDFVGQVLDGWLAWDKSDKTGAPPLGITVHCDAAFFDDVSVPGKRLLRQLPDDFDTLFAADTKLTGVERALLANGLIDLPEAVSREPTG